MNNFVNMDFTFKTVHHTLILIYSKHQVRVENEFWVRRAYKFQVKYKSKPKNIVDSMLCFKTKENKAKGDQNVTEE